jgi:uncharacterized protein
MENTNKISKINFKNYASFLLIIFFLIALVFFLTKSGNFGNRAPKREPISQVSEIKYVKIAGQTVKVDLATTPKEQEQGLSGRISLADDTGMLFVFPQAGKYFFWMKDMNFPIDIVWLDENLRVIYIQKKALPESYPKTFGSEKESLYILEVSAGFLEKNNLKEGDKAEFLR